MSCLVKAIPTFHFIFLGLISCDRSWTKILNIFHKNKKKSSFLIYLKRKCFYDNIMLKEPNQEQNKIYDYIWHELNSVQNISPAPI